MVARLCDKYHNIVLVLIRMFKVKVNSTISVLFVLIIYVQSTIFQL